MAVVKTHTATAQNSFSGKFPLSASPVRVSFTGTSSVQIRLYALADGTTVTGTLEITDGISEFTPVFRGLFDIGVPTGGYVDSTVITVEQE
jgi:hypothetical protein